MKIIFNFLLLTKIALASCFLAVEGDKTLQEQGNCNERYSPCSSFKFPLSLMGFEEEILTNETTPEWPFENGYVDDLELWKQPHNPTLWMKHSCVWFSQVLTKKLGMEKFQSYVDKFSYGNQDLKGDVGKNNGITRSWLMSSLKISAREQVTFLNKFLKRDLDLNPHTYEMTKNILYVGDLEGGWKLYGKTGTGWQWDEVKKAKNPKRHQGWFVGWIEKDNRKIVFAKLIVDTEDMKEGDLGGGQRAREETKKLLSELIK